MIKFNMYTLEKRKCNLNVQGINIFYDWYLRHFM